MLSDPAAVAADTGGTRLTRGARLLAAPLAAVLVVALALGVPKLTADPFLLSFVTTVVVAVLATLHVWLLLRVNLLSFASPPFMAIGGYALALIAMDVTNNAIVLVLLCFLVPALAAVPLGLVLLRLKGTYFALVTFVLAQVVVLIVVIAEGPLGGNSGISGVPAAALGGQEFGAGGPLLRFSVAVGLLGVAIAAISTVLWRRQFAAIDENEPLAATLGLRPWIYKTVAFVIAAGLAGLAGAVLINQLGNAHPDTFSPFSSVNHVAGAVVGGTSILGPLIGASLLSWLHHIFASEAEYSQLFLGVSLIVVVLFARAGITGTIHAGAVWALGKARPGAAGGAGHEETPAEQRRSAETSVQAHEDVPTGRAAALARRRGAQDQAPVLVVEDLGRNFGGVAAVDGISFGMKPGEVLGVIGPNGAGKTTLINMVSGQMPPSRGSIRLDGQQIGGAPVYSVNRKGVARSFQQTSVFAAVSVRENFARGRTFSPRWIDEDELRPLLKSTGLADRMDERAGDLPYGLQKLLGLLLPMCTTPRVLLLDEPAAGLERSERTRIDELVDWAVERGCAVLLVEHDMDLVRRICPRVIVMDVGQPLAEGPPDTVFQDHRVITAYLGVADDEEAIADTPPSTDHEQDVPVLDAAVADTGAAPSSTDHKETRRG